MSRYPLDPPPEWHKVCDYIDGTELEMRAIESSTEKDTQKCWNVLRLHNRRTRHIYNLRTSGSISKELYNYLVQNFYCDHALVCYWKKNGYENLCCLRCVQSDTKHGNVCICRVPRRNLAPQGVECDNCGCTGCSGH